MEIFQQTMSLPKNLSMIIHGLDTPKSIHIYNQLIIFIQFD